MVFANCRAICAMASCCCEEEEDEEEEEEEAAFGSSNFGNSGNCGKSIVPNGVSILFDDEGASVSMAFNRTDFLSNRHHPFQRHSLWRASSLDYSSSRKVPPLCFSPTFERLL